MEYGIIVIVLILLFVAFVILQETSAQLHWRKLVNDGDVTAIRDLIEMETEHWRTSRVPKGTSPLLWHGVQSASLLEVTPRSARVSCNAEGEFAMTNGVRIETSSALAQGMKITMKLAEMLLYDVPNVKLDHVQIDVYTAFRDAAGRAEPQCILSTLVTRRQVEAIDWEETTAADFITLNDGRFVADERGGVHPVTPLTWAEEPARST